MADLIVVSYRNWLSEIGIGIGVIIAVLLGINAALLNSSNKISDERQIHKTTTEEQPSKQPPVEPQQRPTSFTPTNPPSDEHNQRASENANPGTDDGLFWGDGIAQWIMAITGIAALGISAWAVWLVVRSLELNRKMVSEAEKATKAAQDTVSVTYKMAQRQLRAYLFVVAKAIVFKPNEPLRIIFSYENAGQTPAYDVRCYRTFIDAPYPLPEDQFLPESIEESEARQEVVARAIVYPKGDFSGDQGTPFPCTADSLRAKIANGRFYFVGFAIYVDVFKRRRTTKFCSTIPGRYIEMAIKSPGALIEASFEFTSYHNEAD